ncbi:MAG: ABC transporter substrate-binding protein [Gammaproteobacteria bacterium]|nr:ABC transporter substrate-binding protein [Gammaproteobacteria bacterium]MDH5652903.1 ABC transporter substrate-binding protein [Gammaproteobacteria bacterium]
MKARYCILAALCCLWPLHAQSVDKTTGLSAGKQLYRSGQRSSGVDLTAYVGRAAIAMPANSLPCVGCHGRDGKGRPEGGVKPSNINWSELSKDYGGVSAGGRKFGKYNEDSFLRAVTQGVDPAGNPLDSSMPRYNISRHDARDLIAYLKHLENEYDPGINNSEIVFVTLQPQQGWEGKLGKLISTTLQACFDDVNRQGGIYGRKLKLEEVAYKDAEDFDRVAKQTMAGEKHFAMLGSFSGSLDQRLTAQSEKLQIPSIAPFTNHLSALGNEHRYTFYLYGGIDTQIEVLLKQAVKDKVSSRYVILHRENSQYAGNARQASAVLQRSGIKDVTILPYRLDKHDWVKRLNKTAEPVKLLFLGASTEIIPVYDQLKSRLQVKSVYMPGMLVSSQILTAPAELADKLVFAYQVTPDKTTNLNDFYGFMQRHNFGREGMSIRLFAYSAARVTIEGLKRSGKRLGRENLITALEHLYEFDAGLSQPISFGSSRRIGLRGAYIVKLDQQHKTLKPVSDWIALE